MKPTKQELIAAREASDSERTALHIALNAVLNGETSPVFRKGEHKLILAHVNKCHGGVVLHTFAPRDTEQKPYTCAYYWEQWYAGVRNDTGECESTRDLREIAGRAQAWVFGEQVASRALRSAAGYANRMSTVT